MTRLIDSVASIQYAKAPIADIESVFEVGLKFDMLLPGLWCSASGLCARVGYWAVKYAMEFPIRPADLSHIPK